MSDAGVERSIDREVARIGERIRRWRDEQGLTLQDLASRSGLATSTIQKVETRQMVPSVAVLLKIAYGLGRRPGELIHEGAEDEDVSHVRADGRDRTGSEGRVTLERLSGDVSNPALEMWRVTLWPGASSGKRPIHYAGEDLVWCEQGRVTFTVGEADYPLEAGDSLHFKAHLPHRWENRSARPARFTIAGTLPAKLRSLIRRGA